MPLQWTKWLLYYDLGCEALHTVCSKKECSTIGYPQQRAFESALDESRSRARVVMTRRRITRELDGIEETIHGIV